MFVQQRICALEHVLGGIVWWGRIGHGCADGNGGAMSAQPVWKSRLASGGLLRGFSRKIVRAYGVTTIPVKPVAFARICAVGVIRADNLGQTLESTERRRAFGMQIDQHLIMDRRIAGGVD